MQGRGQPFFSHLSPICKSPLGNGGGGGSEIFFELAVVRVTEGIITVNA